MIILMAIYLVTTYQGKTVIPVP